MTEAPAVLEGISIAFGGEPVVRDVSLSVPRGAVYALLGRNGAGKTSLVRCLLGQRRPATGRALLFGREAHRHRAAAMERVGVVPEEPDAPAGMTPDALSRFCGRIYPRWDGSGVAARLDRLGVPRRTPFGRLSRGERGSVLFALALGASPDLVVLDDPTLGLDAVARQELYADLVGDLADRGTTVFLTTHDLAGIEGIVDRVGILAAGRLVLDEGLEGLKGRFRRITYTNAITPSRTEYGSELDLFEAARVRVRGWGVDAVVSNFAEERLERFRAQDGVSVGSVAAMSLEEIFVAVAGSAPAEERRVS